MSTKFRFATDFNKYCLTYNFHKRGWIQTDVVCGFADDWELRHQPQDDGDWHFYWAQRTNTHRIFGVENGYRLNDDQLILHFPNHFELTRKVRICLLGWLIVCRISCLRILSAIGRI